MRNLILLLVMLTCSYTIHATPGYEELKGQENVSVKYKWKADENGKKRLYIKFKNKSKSPLQTTTEIAFFMDGIQKESTRISTCLKKGFFANLFQSPHTVSTEEDYTTFINKSEFSLEVTELQTEKVEACEAEE
jgi:hypothetical protein